MYKNRQLLAIACLVTVSSEASATTRPIPRVAEIESITSHQITSVDREVASSHSKLPLVFEPNRGQADKRAKWIARGPGYTLFLTDSDATMVLRGEASPSSVVRMKLAGSRNWDQSKGLEPTGGISNYFLGKDPKAWRTDIPHYQRVTHSGVYKGIDLVFYGNGGSLEYDFVVAPAADPKQIRLAYEGVERIELDAATGELVLATANGATLRQPRPHIYQEIAGEKVEVAGVYEILDRGDVAIQVAFYDANRELVIDPRLVYSTYLGGSNSDSNGGIYFGVPGAIAVEIAGSAYVAGSTFSTDFPTKGRLLPYRSAGDGFVAKLAPDGKSLVYSTYLGGSSTDSVSAIAVDSDGSAYVTGSTDSTNFPIKLQLQTNQRNTDAFVTKLTAKGNSLLYSTISEEVVRIPAMLSLSTELVQPMWLAARCRSTSH